MKESLGPIILFLAVIAGGIIFILLEYCKIFAWKKDLFNFIERIQYLKRKKAI